VAYKIGLSKMRIKNYSGFHRDADENCRLKDFTQRGMEIPKRRGTELTFCAGQNLIRVQISRLKITASIRFKKFHYSKFCLYLLACEYLFIYLFIYLSWPL
jgi:hypothetical protein